MKDTKTPHSAESELEFLVGLIHFTGGMGDTRSGRHFLVTAQPWAIENEPSHFRAQVRVQPLDAEARALLPCRVVLLGEMAVIPPGPTNERGDVFFQRLPHGAYEVYLAETAAGLRTNAADLPAVAHCAPASARFAPADAGTFDPVRLLLPDRPIKLELSQGADGRAILTFETRNPALAGAGHTWSLGGESGWFELEPAGERWLAESHLAMSAVDARAIILQLVVSPDFEA
jgi:hypothetical protein